MDPVLTTKSRILCECRSPHGTLDAGAHVLCERPLALSPAGVERILAARQRAGRVVMVGMNHRFRSDVQAVREFLRRGELGRLTAIRWNGRREAVEVCNRWRVDEAWWRDPIARDYVKVAGERWLA